jgi:hypothetical protein
MTLWTFHKNDLHQNFWKQNFNWNQNWCFEIYYDYYYKFAFLETINGVIDQCFAFGYSWNYHLYRKSWLAFVFAAENS